MIFEIKYDMMGLNDIRFGNRYFKFYKTWLDTIEEMPEDARGNAALAILRYYDGKDIGDDLDERVIGLMGVVKTQIDYNIQRRRDKGREGMNGGRHGDER